MNTIQTALRRLAAAAAIILSASTVSAETTAVGDLASHTHIHGLAIDAADPQHLFIATHHGLYRAAPDGTAERISVVQDFMGFTVIGPKHYLASGHPGEGESGPGKRSALLRAGTVRGDARDATDRGVRSVKRITRNF